MIKTKDSTHLKILGIGDLHFGNPRIKAQSLYMKLRKFVYPELRNTHLVILTGDTYDQLLTVNSESHRFAAMFVNDLIRISADTGMQLRILHGTYSHDRDQLSIFETLSVPNARFKVINSIECEELSDFNSDSGRAIGTLRIAYLPDNLPYKRSGDAIDHLKRTLTCVGWSSVDALVGHGTFEHVIPPGSGHKPPCLYTVEQFKKIVPNGPIIMGHIHTPGRNRNVYYCGSFERMVHGEEESKGFYTFFKDVNTTNGWTAKFIKNELATPFVSISPKGDDIPAITNDFLEQADDKFPVRTGFVRVLHPSSEVRSLLHKVCSQQFPELTYTSKATGEREKTEMRVDEITLDIFDDMKPDINNLGHLVHQFLEEKNLLDNITKDVIVETTKKLIYL